MYISEVQAGQKPRKRRFYSPYLGEIQGSTSTEAAIDITKAVSRNRYHAQQLGWSAQFNRIAEMLGFRDRSPDEASFARAVARWQASQPGLSVDGVIGPNAWKAMRAIILPVPNPPAGPTPQPGQVAAPDAAAFLERVLQAHIARSTKIKGQPQPDLRIDQLAPVPGTNVEMRNDAAAAAGRMIAAANQDLAAAKSAGDNDALNTVRISATSGYRGREHQERLWRGAFPSYYSETATKRASLPGGPHGDTAVQLMVKSMSPYIAAPGFSNHQAGVAIDLKQERTRGNEVYNLRQDKWVRKLRDTWFFRWLQSNAARFSFHPYEVEPWHWVYRP